MTSKLVWASIFGVGTTAGGGAAYFLPEKLWSDANIMVIYKKGVEEDDKSNLRVGGTEENKFALGTQNSESLLKIGEKGIEDISSNYGNTQNNSFWLIGAQHNRYSSSQLNKKNMKREGDEKNSQGSLTIFLTDISCNNLERYSNLKNDAQIKISCKSKGDQHEKLFSKSRVNN